MSRFVQLHSRSFVEKKWYPRFTMIGQSLGSMVLGLEALFRVCPDVFLDTMGYSFTFPIFRFLGGCWVGCYVHYPTISTDMFNKVAFSASDFNNDKAISQSSAKTQAKLIYYTAFGFLYKMMGKCSQLTMVNSSWTRNHIRSIWNPSNLHLVFPPVDCAGFRGFPLTPRKNLLVSVGQFRKEKDHMMQLEAFNIAIKQFPSDSPLRSGNSSLQLVMIGSTRDHVKGDQKRVLALQQRTLALGLQIVVNAPKSELNHWLSQALIGLHTMKDEHFGIGVVELMASGVIPVAHNSAGPKEDIVSDPKTGFLATTPNEFAQHITTVLNLTANTTQQFQIKARESTNRFSDEVFQKAVIDALSSLPALKKILHQ